MPLNVLGALVGDIYHEPSARTKYGLLFDALQKQVQLVGVYNATLRGVARWRNALAMFHPNWQRWRQGFYHNPQAFQLRSQQFAAYMRQSLPTAQVTLQVGVMFDATDRPHPHPNVIYTDYTDRMLTHVPASGRLYLSPDQHARWMALEQRAYERAAHICTRSARVRASVVQDYGIAAERVTVVGGGVNFATLPPVNPARHAPRHAPPTVLFIGKELRRKGGDLLLQAFALARQTVPEARLLMLTGDPLPNDLPQTNVEVIPPTWDRTVIAELYQRSDLFVLPSRLETWGDVLLEAMAYGMPCIGVSGQAMDEIIRPEQTGLLAPPGAAPALAEALTRLLTDANLRQRLGQTARRVVETEYTWDVVTARLLPILAQAAKG